MQGTCGCIQKFLKLDYKKIGLTENRRLPKWLNCEIIDSVIYLWGVPKRNDEPEIQIRIID